MEVDQLPDGSRPRPGTRPVDLVLAGHRIRFTAEAQDLIDPALSTLAPPCAVEEPGAKTAGWSVEVMRATRTASRRRGHPIFGWTESGRQLKILDAADDRLVLAGHYRAGCAAALIEVDARTRQTRVLLPPGDEPSRRWPDWVGRMFFGTRLLADGWHLVHAAAVSIDTDAGPRAVLFLAGPHGGKSTLAHRACVELSAKLLSDDLVLLRPRAGGVDAVGWPTRVSVPMDLLDPTAPATDSGATVLDRVEGRQRHRLVLSPPEYAARFEVQRAGPTTLGSIVVINSTSVDADVDGLVVDPGLGADRLGAALTIAAQIPAQRLMMLDLLGVAGPSARPPAPTELARADLLAALRAAEIAAVEVGVPDLSRLPALPIWTALASGIPWLSGGAP